MLNIKDNELLIRTLILDGIFDKRRNKKKLMKEVDEIYELFIKINNIK